MCAVEHSSPSDLACTVNMSAVYFLYLVAIYQFTENRATVQLC